MLKIEMVPGKPTVVQASGSLGDIIAEIGVAIGSVHDALKQNQPEAALAFKMAMQHVMIDEAPTWSDQVAAGGISFVIPGQ